MCRPDEECFFLRDYSSTCQPSGTSNASNCPMLSVPVPVEVLAIGEMLCLAGDFAGVTLRNLLGVPGCLLGVRFSSFSWRIRMLVWRNRAQQMRSLLGDRRVLFWRGLGLAHFYAGEIIIRNLNDLRYWDHGAFVHAESLNGKEIFVDNCDLLN